MRGIWAIARHTLSHCLRMKIAGAFVLMLLAILAVLPLILQGDGTLAGRIRTLLAYGMGVTGFLLSVVTLLLSAGVITSDVRGKAVFTVATKPLSRWNYVVGRWLGVVMFVAILLTTSAVAIYAFAQHLRTGSALNPSDRRAVETEVFTARRQVRPQPIDIDTLTDRKRRQLRDEGRYQEAMNAFIAKTGGDEHKAQALLEEQIRSEVAGAAQSVEPGGVFLWQFNGVTVAGNERTAKGQVTLVDEETGSLRILAGDEILGRLVFGGPVRVNGVDLRVTRLEKDFFEVQPTDDDRAGGRLASLVPGAEADIVADPTIQLSYKATASVDPTDKLLRSLWQLNNPTTGLRYMELRSDPVATPATLTVSARLVDPNGRMDAQYVNLPDSRGKSTSVTILENDIAVLFRMGSFEGTFIRGAALVLLQLAFLAAVGVAAGSFLSFPVACLVGFATLPLSMAGGFLSESLRLNPESAPATDAITLVGAWIFRVVHVLLPDFAQTSPVDSLINGMNISWEYLTQAALLTGVIRTLPILAIACLIFQRRELARVQV
jgi:hypothetical protein